MTSDSGPTLYVKDLVVSNDLGTENVGQLGTVRVVNLVTTADVGLGGWTPSTGTTGYNILDNNPPNEAIYLAADSTPPAAMEFALADLPDDISSVKAVVSYVYAKKTDGGDGTLQVSMVSNAAESNGTDRAITTGSNFWRDVHEIDPDTTTAWTRVSVNAATLKIDRTS